MIKFRFFHCLAVALVLLAILPTPGASAKQMLRKLKDTSNPDLGSCFSAESTIQVRGKGEVAMRDLKVGDEVLSWRSNHYQPVYTFLHRNELVKAEYLRVETNLSSSKPLEITRDHLLYVQGKSSPVPAGSVVVGDILQGKGGEPASVTDIASIWRTDGVFAPATPDGTLVVDGIQVSSYVVLMGMENHYFLGLDTAFVQHMALSPFRFFCRWVSGSRGQSLNEKGLTPMVSGLSKLKSWVVQQPICVQVPSIFCYLVVAAAFWILEFVLDKIAVVSFGMVLVAGVVVALSPLQKINHVRKS